MVGNHLFHEWIDPRRPARFTRRWFSWADMLYVELVLAAAGTRSAERAHGDDGTGKRGDAASAAERKSAAYSESGLARPLCRMLARSRRQRKR